LPLGTEHRALDSGGQNRQLALADLLEN